MRCPDFLAIALICLFGLLKTTNSDAATPSVHVAPKPVWLSTCRPYDQKPAMRDVQNGYYFDLIERQINIETNADYHHTIRQIVSEAGIQNGSQINVSFDPSYERLDFHQITVWRDGKPQNRLNISAFKVIADEQDLSKFIYQGSYSALCILGDIRKGDKIEYSYTITGRNPIFGQHFSKIIYMQGGQVYNHEYVSILASSQRTLHVKPFNNVPNVKISQQGNLKKYEWESFQVPEIHDTDNEPDWYDEYGHIQISDFNTWAEVADWAQKINPPSLNITGDLARQVAKLKAAAGDDKEAYFRAAVKTVQDEVRYMGIEIGEYSHRANDPEQVFKQRYGDCKDKSLLLVSMLRANGIEAYMVFLNTGMGMHLDDLLPSSSVFDHAVVMAVLNGKQVWVDATISYQRGLGSNIYFPDYGRGLVLRPGEKGLTMIPNSPAGKTISEEKYTISKNSKKVRLDVKTVYTLNEADRMREKLASSGMSEIEKSYLDYYSKTYSTIEKRDSVRVHDDEKTNTLTTYESYTVGDLLKQNDKTGKYNASFYADMIENLLPSIGNKTKTPVDVNYPNNIDYTIKVVLPGGWDMTNTDTAIKRDAYSFSSAYAANGDTLSLNYKFAYLKSFVPANQVDQFRQDIKKLKDDELSYSVSFSLDDQPTATNTTWNGWMVFYVTALLLIMAAIGFWYYRQETPGIVFTKGSDFTPIGGWLVLVLIGLILSPIAAGMFLFNHNYFDMTAWNAYHGRILEGFYHITFVLEATGNVVNLGLSAYCLILFIKRRDILPQFIIAMFTFRAAYTIIDHIMYAGLHNMKDLLAPSSQQVFTVIIAVAWIIYFKRSTRVQETFIVPYPETNFSYEREDVVFENV